MSRFRNLSHINLVGDFNIDLLKLKQKEHTKLEREVAKLEREKETLENKFSTEAWDPEEIQKQSIILKNSYKILKKRPNDGFYFQIKWKISNSLLQILICILLIDNTRTCVRLFYKC